MRRDVRGLRNLQRGDCIDSLVSRQDIRHPTGATRAYHVARRRPDRASLPCLLEDPRLPRNPAHTGRSTLATTDRCKAGKGAEHPAMAGKETVPLLANHLQTNR